MPYWSVFMTYIMRTSDINNLEHVDSQPISYAARKIRSSYHTMLKATPDAAIFGKICSIGLIIHRRHWVGKRRQKQVDKTTLMKAYSINDYKVGNKVPKINKIYGKKAQRHTISIMVLT